MTELAPPPEAPSVRVPSPDPTSLTTAGLRREVGHLRELLEATDSAIGAHLTAQIQDVHRQLGEADLRYQQRYDSQTPALDAARVATDLAVSAALIAADKSVSKAEIAAEKRYDTVSKRIDDLKEDFNKSITTLNSTLAGMAGRSGGHGESWIYLVGAIGLLATIIAIYSAVKP
jgi:hypothetical protein